MDALQHGAVVKEAICAGYSGLNPSQQKEIDARVKELSDAIHQLGPSGALEIIGKIAILMVLSGKAKRVAVPKFRVVNRVGDMVFVKVHYG